ncbi:DUF1648 domain-containing protein [Psychroserpens sp. SPM9]|uniref:DUF1648 domain-containing protein n=1 Tax=Psychroserpens sp. SPM9 TaxID=2975598 RepID=UPI0021A86AE3|nr:DUF1648 domain-containing protein [Psychroserpens sp. SPM9]MDG5493119.1 DUF1648 domain-containing protein [Psychroserpens sp. SPM9]
MKSERPKIKVPWEPLDIITDLISISLIVAMIAYTLLYFGELSDTIPTHFNASGEADGFNDKIYIWMLPLVGVFTFSLLFFLNTKPHIHNYMVPITEDNALKNYRFSTRVLRFTNLFVAIIFSVIQYIMVEKGRGNPIRLGGWFLPVVIGFSILLPIFIFVYNKKLNAK